MIDATLVERARDAFQSVMGVPWLTASERQSIDVVVALVLETHNREGTMPKPKLKTISRDQYLQLAGLLALGKQSEQRSKDVRDGIAELLGISDQDRDHDWISEAVFEGFSPDKLLEKLGIPLLFNDGLANAGATESRTGAEIIGDAHRRIADRYAPNPSLGGDAAHGGQDETAAFLQPKPPADTPNAGGPDSP